MSTFAEMKTALSRRLTDPDTITFDDDMLSDMINEAIQEVSRIAPQPFIEDVEVIAGRYRYQLRGGTANQVPNWSFESGDTTVLQSGAVLVDPVDAPTLLEGWNLLAVTPLHLNKSPKHVSGLRALRMNPAVGQTDATAYVDIPVNPGTAYLISGYHCKQLAGGNVSRIEVETRDSNNDFIDDIFHHDTSADTMVQATFTYTTADDGSEVYLRIKLICMGTQPTVQQAFLFDDIVVSEASQSVLVATNAVNSIEVSKVEIWKTVDGVASMWGEIESPGYVRGKGGDASWRMWGGAIEIPARIVDGVGPDMAFRVWGYAPYDVLTDDEQVTDLTAELEQATLQYAELLGWRRLHMRRGMFTQWQQQANATDVTPAQLLSTIMSLEQIWNRKKRDLYVLRA